MALTIALLGSGEFEPWTAEVDRWLLARAAVGDGRVLILPTASAREGDEVFDRWGDLGLRHYQSLGIPAEVVPLKARSDASRPELVGRLQTASLVFFSGGNPAYLADTLADTPFWRELRTALDRGLAYAGCSAGIACLGERAGDSTIHELTAERWRPGLRLFPGVYLGPHWDRLNSFRPELREFLIGSMPSDGALLAVDERTAVVGDGVEWRVMGSGSAHLLRQGEWQHFPAGKSFSAALGPP